MILSGLKQLCASIKGNKYTYAVFKFSKNGVIFDVFFDIGTIPFKLGFIIRKSNFDLWLDVNKGFEMNPIIEYKKYRELIKLLGLKFDPDNKFSSYLFFQEFNSQIPTSFVKPNSDIVKDVSICSYDIEDSVKIYYKQLAIWTNQFRSEKNTEKTRLLFPLIFEHIKNRPRISVCYTHIANEIKDCGEM